MIGSVRILVYHRNHLIRDCLARILSQNPAYDAQAGETFDSSQCIELPRNPIDVILVDLNLPEGMAVDLTKNAVARCEQTKVVLIIGDDHSHFLDCLSAGAHGCVLEQMSLKELEPAIERVMSGETFCSSDMAGPLFVSLAKVTRTHQLRVETSEIPLTVRETEILELLAERMSNKQIAKRLFISLYTVKNHVHNILEKMRVPSRRQAVDEWLQVYSSSREMLGQRNSKGIRFR